MDKESEFGGKRGLVQDPDHPTEQEQLMLMYQESKDDTPGGGER